MSFELSYKVELSTKSAEVYDKFVLYNKEKKEVDVHDVFELLAKAACAFAGFTLVNGKRLGVEQQRQLLTILFETLVKDEANGFSDIPKISEIIDTVLKLRDGNLLDIVENVGKGCLSCL